MRVIGEILQTRYQINSVLGQGSMGTTYKARDLQTDQELVLKQLRLSRMHDWKTLELFEREAKILKQLKHPRIPAYLEYFTFETPSDVYFVLVQAYIAGKTLQQQVEEGWRGTDGEIFEIVRQVGEILDYLHTLQPPVVHRDINPKNILLTSTNEAYLVDFGAVQEKIRSTVFAGSTMVGTNGYVPYEQFLGRAVPASDYYALGATVLYLLTQTHPADFPTKQLKPQLPSLCQASPNMNHLLHRLLEPVAGNRLQSPEGIREILEKTPEELHSYKSTSTKPYGSKIEKTVSANQLCFRIPHSEASDTIIAFVIMFIGGSGCMAGSLVEAIKSGFNWDVLPFFVIGGFFLILALWILWEILGHTLLILSPEWINISCKYFGRCSTHRIPMVSLQKSDITWYSLKINQRLGLNHAGETIDLGPSLTQVEIEWLIQEINEYYTFVFGKPLS